MILFLNGKYVAEQEAKVSVFDQGFLYGDGVYETMRTYKGVLWRPDAHMQRLERSLAVAGMRLPYSFARLIDQIKMLIRKNQYREARVRVMITRGQSASKGARFAPNEKGKVTICITCYPLTVFVGKKVRLPEVGVMYFPVERSFPTVKTTSLFPLVLARMQALKAGLFDVLLVDREGCVSEGAVSNLFVVRKGILYTPRSGVLPGVTREEIVRLARVLVRKKVLKKIVYGHFKKSFIRASDEIFLTNAPSGVVAVTKVGERPVGNGLMKGIVGPVTRAIHEAFIASVS